MEPQRSKSSFFPHTSKFISLTLEESLASKVNLEAQGFLREPPQSLY